MLETKRVITCLFWCVGFMASTVCAEEFTVEQKNKSFMYEGSHVTNMALKVGDTIKFQNNDTVFHNIFSLSEIMSFNLGAYDKGQSRKVVFDKVGTIHVECAIHPRMVLEVMVK